MIVASKSLSTSLLALLLLLPALESTGQPAKKASRQEAAGASRAIATSDFPDRIAGMSRIGVTSFKQSELGFSVRYVGPDKATWADVYVYDKGLDLVSADRAAHLKAEIVSSVGDVKTMVERGLYRNVSLSPLSRQGQFATVGIESDVNEKRTASLLALTVHRDKFVKLRLSTPAGPSSSSIQTSFLEALSRQFGI